MANNGSVHNHSPQFWNEIKIKCVSDPDHIKALIQNKSLNINDVNELQQTLLLIASEQGSYKIVELCINLGANIKHTDYYGKTALDKARLHSYFHIEQLLLFKSMKANVGNRVRHTSNTIKRQKAITQNITNVLQNKYDVITRDFFQDTIIDIMSQIIKQKLAFSDDLLSLCWTLVCHNDTNTDPFQSELWRIIASTCEDVIKNGNKRDWDWFKTYVVSSSVWYEQDTEHIKAQQSEQKQSPDQMCAVCFCEFEETDEYVVINKCGHTLHKDCAELSFKSNITAKMPMLPRCPQCFQNDKKTTLVTRNELESILDKQTMDIYLELSRNSIHHDDEDKTTNEKDSTPTSYLYYKLLDLVQEESKNQLHELKVQLDDVEAKNETAWNELVKWDIPDTMASEDIRQDAIPNGIVSKYQHNELSEYASVSGAFNIHSFYDFNEYLAQLVLLAQTLDDEFQKSIQNIFNVDKHTNIGTIFDNNNERNLSVHYIRGPVKLMERSKTKAENDYFDERFPTSACVLDLNRASLVFDDIGTLLLSLQHFTQQVQDGQTGNIIGIIRDKNGFTEYVKETQYADIKLNVMIKGKLNNIVGEIQWLLTTMKQYKNNAHNLYNVTRQRDYIEHSIANILPILLDDDKQLFVSSSMGDVKTLSKLMYEQNKSEAFMMKIDDKSNESVLVNICKRGHDKAFAFLQQVISPQLFADRLLATVNSPIQGAIWNNQINIVQRIFSMQVIVDKYKSNHDELFKLMCMLFGNDELLKLQQTTNVKTIEIVISLLNVTNEQIRFLISYKPSKEVERNSIIGCAARSSVGVIKYLVSKIGETMFVDHVLVSDYRNINGIEYCIKKKQIEILKYILSLEHVVDKCLSEKETLWRIVWWMANYYDADIARCLMTQLKLNEKILRELQAFKCRTMDDQERQQFHVIHETYWDESINNKRLDKLLKINVELDH
eukprot:263768_1